MISAKNMMRQPPGRVQRNSASEACEKQPTFSPRSLLSRAALAARMSSPFGSKNLHNRTAVAFAIAAKQARLRTHCWLDTMNVESFAFLAHDPPARTDVGYIDKRIVTAAVGANGRHLCERLDVRVFL